MANNLIACIRNCIELWHPGRTQFSRGPWFKSRRGFYSQKIALIRMYIKVAKQVDA